MLTTFAILLTYNLFGIDFFFDWWGKIILAILVLLLLFGIGFPASYWTVLFVVSIFLIIGVIRRFRTAEAREEYKKDIYKQFRPVLESQGKLVVQIALELFPFDFVSDHSKPSVGNKNRTDTTDVENLRREIAALPKE